MVVFIIPASLPRRIRSMRFTNWLSVGCVIYVAAMCVTFSSLGKGAAPHSDHGKGVSFFPPHSPLKMLTTVPVVIFAFTCHQNAFSVASELKNRTLAKLDLIVAIAISLSLVLYMTTALAGYLQFGSSADVDMLNSYDSSWIAVRFGKLFVTMSVIFSFPMQCHPFRRSFGALCSCNHEISTHQERKIFRVSTMIFFISTASTALLVKDLGIVFQLIGTICSNTLCYIAPPAIYLGISRATDNNRIMRTLAWSLLLLGLLILPMSLTAIWLTK